jgi:chromosome segregation ATPase
MSSEAKVEPDPMLELVGKQNAMIKEVWEQVGALTKQMAEVQAALSKHQAAIGKMDKREKHQASTFLKFTEAIAKMNDRLDATVVRLDMCEASADASNNAGEAKH